MQRTKCGPPGSNVFMTGVLSTAGPLVRDFLVGASSSPLDYSKAVLDHSSDFNGFSLITADLK